MLSVFVSINVSVEVGATAKTRKLALTGVTATFGAAKMTALMVTYLPRTWIL